MLSQGIKSTKSLDLEEQTDVQRDCRSFFNFKQDGTFYSVNEMVVFNRIRSLSLQKHQKFKFSILRHLWSQTTKCLLPSLLLRLAE